MGIVCSVVADMWVCLEYIWQPWQSSMILSMDFVSQEHGVPRDGPKDSNAGAERVRSWITMKHGDGSLESPNTLPTAEKDTELYPGLGPSW
jgi:hypothetical protein